MKTNPPFNKKFQEIAESQAFDRLDHFKDISSWTALSSDEKEQLAMLFVMQGEFQLKQGDGKVIESFETASKICPQNPKILYRQAIAFALQQDNIRCLTAACKMFQTVTMLKPDFFDAWYGWANTLVRMGSFYNETIYFQDANQKFIEAESLSEACKEKDLRAFYWHWGVNWYQLGKVSGEAVDFKNALDKYKKAFDLNCPEADFYNDYGNALVEMALLVSRQEMFGEAIDCYLKAVKKSPLHFDAWLNLACTYHKLYSLEYSEEYYRSANLCFEKATAITKDNGILWLKWAQMIALAGKMEKDVEKLRSAVEKFERADACEPDHPMILSSWGEALMLWGTYIDDLNLLKFAEEKFIRSMELCPESPEIWYLYGSCLNELGRYFSDEGYYLQAIEKFQQGMAICKTDPLLWYGLALAHFAIGELKNDEAMIEKAVQYCTQVIELGGQIFPQFWNDWGVALMKLGEMTNKKNYVEAAVDKFSQAIHRQGSTIDYEYVDPEWLYNYGCALDFLGDFNEEPSYYERAVEVLSRVVQMEPHYTHARYNLALALNHLGELTADVDCLHKALEQFQILLAQDTEDEMGWNDYGLTLLNLAQLIHENAMPENSHKLYEIAESKLLHSLSLGCKQALYNLACLYSLAGNYSNAMQYLERAEMSGALPAIEDVLHDEWLEGLRSTNVFRTFIVQLSNKREGGSRYES